MHRCGARARLAAHERNRLWRRTDERQSRVKARPGKRGILGEKPVPRMDGVRAGGRRRVDQPVNTQIALGSGTGADVDRLIRIAHVARAAITVGVHRDRRNPELPTGTNDAHRDFSAVRNEHFHDANCSR